MLPVVICEPDVVARGRWMAALERLAAREFSGLKLEMLPGAEHELARAIESQRGIMLVILAVSRAIEGGVDRSIQFFDEIMTGNHDNYVVLSLHDNASLDAVLAHCMRPAGILLNPLREELMLASLRRVLSDYQAIDAQDSPDDYLVINAEKTIHRIACRDILYLEAQDKLLNICTRRRILRVRERLSAIAEMLPEGFVRCHRSYVVNLAHIERQRLSDMMLVLTNQEQIPFSRQYRDELRNRLKAVMDG